MGHSRTIFIAVGGSIALHLLGLELYARYGSGLTSPTRFAVAATQPAPELVVSVDPQMVDFGEATGTGIGLNKADGDRPQEAREADENQAYLDRRRAGNSPDGAARQPTPNVGGAAAARQPAPVAPPTPAKQPVTPADVKPDTVAMATLPPPPLLPAKPEPTESKAPNPIFVSPAPIPTPAPPVPTPVPTPAPIPTPPTPQPSPPAQSASGQSGAPPVQGAPVPHSDADSDPFMRLSGSVVFRSGRLDVQLGRKVNTVRPQLGIGGLTDAWAMAQPTLVVEAHIDPTGRVTEVDLPKKTGSPAIDEPTRNAVYQWTFEPTHDKQGRAIADVLFFEIDYR